MRRILGLLAMVSFVATLGAWAGGEHDPAVEPVAGHVCAHPAETVCVRCVPKTETKKKTTYEISQREDFKCVPVVHSHTLACLFHCAGYTRADTQPVRTQALIKKKVVKASEVKGWEAQVAPGR